ncbi:MAG: adenine phosphoribosyltransferase [Oscillospiraceae bacterium]|jgi:adenine phosphoribosyltransferase|nr:adenine phosphoribosyltransferase [Oscillospiraceae bacterium]
MSAVHNMTIAGLARSLPLCPLSDQLSIAAFVIFGDVELTIAAARDLIAAVPEFDFIVTPEAKSIPLAYEMARQTGKKYFVARKKAKLYMQSVVSVHVRSITTDGVQTLMLDGAEGEQLRGKRVLIVDDVISTGESLAAVEALVAKFDGNVVAKAAILAEGDAIERTDITYLGTIPIFQNVHAP